MELIDESPSTDRWASEHIAAAQAPIELTVSRECNACGASFTQLRPGRRAACSLRCRNERLRELNRISHHTRKGRPRLVPGTRTALVCRHCDKQFIYRTNDHGGGRLPFYCSPDCARDALVQRREAAWCSPERLRALHVTQGHGCAICGTTDPGEFKKWHVDHDHACCPQLRSRCGLCFRGILCGRCNLAIGLLQESSEALRRAADYLDFWRSNTPTDVEDHQQLLAAWMST